MRASDRAADSLRPIHFEPNVSKYAEGSCLVQFGDTHVLCTATVEQKVPSWLRDSGRGWITAEYGMLPRATAERTNREAARGRQTGRTQEIQRLIGRSLRAVADLEAMADLQVRVDCDVLQADGGTRTASITGGWVALHLAFQRLVKLGVLGAIPLTDHVAAISCGLADGEALLDLDYLEDLSADADANFVLTGRGAIVEVQMTAERKTFSEEAMLQMLVLARRGTDELVSLQRQTLGLE
ncbi:MAG: ribonuclease PH [Defluviicoccus sp.]|nr:MAG: ribonuclease PH [Defluviicoccus sp.]